MSFPCLSIISPVYMSEGTILPLVNAITKEMEKTEAISNYEIILIEDGSSDQSWLRIMEACRQSNNVKGVKFTRNFGQHNAILAGLMKAKGKHIIVMDCDLQDNPVYIPALLEKTKQDVDIIYTLKEKRKHGIIKNCFAHLFHFLFNWLCGGRNKKISSDMRIGTFSLITERVKEAYIANIYYHMPYLIVLQNLGFASDYIKIEHNKRYSGKSSYSFWKSIDHALKGIISSTDRLLRLTIYGGLIFTALGLFWIVKIVVMHFAYGTSPGWASLCSLIIFSSGLILTNMGLLGFYIAAIFEQSKKQANFIIAKEC